MIHRSNAFTQFPELILQEPCPVLGSPPREESRHGRAASARQLLVLKFGREVSRLLLCCMIVGHGVRSWVKVC